MINSKCNSLDNFDSDLMPDIHSSSDEYAKRFSGEFGEFALGVQGKLTLTILQNHDDIKTILDVGGGHGQLMPFIKDKGYDITIYGSHECCKKRVEEYLDDNKVKFEVGSLINLPYPDRSFDAVICYRQICHLEKSNITESPYFSQILKDDRAHPEPHSMIKRRKRNFIIIFATHFK